MREKGRQSISGGVGKVREKPLDHRGDVRNVLHMSAAWVPLHMSAAWVPLHMRLYGGRCYVAPCEEGAGLQDIYRVHDGLGFQLVRIKPSHSPSTSLSPSTRRIPSTMGGMVHMLARVGWHAMVGVRLVERCFRCFHQL